MEYAVILFLLKTRRKPKRNIDQVKELTSLLYNRATKCLQDFKNLFDPENANNGDVSQPLRSPSPKRRSTMPRSEAVAEKQALVENIDAWAMWLAPPVFIFWNICYWLAYRPWTNRLVSEDSLVMF